jgi:hypothetical protein
MLKIDELKAELDWLEHEDLSSRSAAELYEHIKEVTPSCPESTRSAALRCVEHLLLRMSELVSVKGAASLRELPDVLYIESSLFTNSDGAKTILG